MDIEDEFKSRNKSKSIDVDRLMRNREIQWKVASLLAKKRLDVVNSISDVVIPSDNLYSKYGKRVFDIIISLIALIITIPINIIIGVITLFTLGFPIFFRQERTGRYGEKFTIVKFRNMRNTRDVDGNLLPANQRVTKVGKFFRKTSLDELLNFWNILKGEMSIIGPRPLPCQYMERYSDRHKSRLLVRPGLECPPRDNKNNIRSWNDQFENDVWYVENVSFKTDIKCFKNLIKFTFNKDNSNVRGSASRGSFIGYSIDGEAISNKELSKDVIIDLLYGEKNV